MAEITPQKILDTKTNGFDMREAIGETAEDKYYLMGINLAKRLLEKKQAPRIVIGGDSRFTTSTLKDKLKEGLGEGGVQTFDLGPNLPTPLVYFGYEVYDADAVAVVTASHSSWNWNGIKINFREDTDISHQRRKYQSFTNSYGLEGIKEFYKASLQEKFIDLEPLKVALDPLCGSYSHFAEEILTALNHRVITNGYLHHKSDGFFSGLAENSPDPHKEKNLEHLVETVKRCQGKLDFGMAFDGDGDRVKFVDDKGRIISEDEITALLAKYFIERHKEKYGENSKPKIIVEIKSSKLVEDAVNLAGGEIIREQTGRIYIKEHMARDSSIIFGGELSGHYFYRKKFCGQEFYPVDTGEDGLFTALLVGKILDETKVKFSTLIKPNPYLTSGEIRYTYKKGEPLNLVKPEIEQILSLLESSYRGDQKYKYQKIGDDARVESKSPAYKSVVFRSSKNDPQKFTFVFEAEDREKLRECQADFLQKVKDGGYNSLEEGLRNIFEKLNPADERGKK